MIKFIKEVLCIMTFLFIAALMLGVAAILIEVFAENTMHRIVWYIITVSIITPIATRISERIL